MAGAKLYELSVLIYVIILLSLNGRSGAWYFVCKVKTKIDRTIMWGITPDDINQHL